MAKNIRFGVPLFAVSFVVFALALYGGAKLVEQKQPAAPAQGAAVPTQGPTTPGGPVTVTVVAKDLRFNVKTITASPGAQVTINFENQDPGVLHNIAFYTDSSASQKIFVGALVTGVASKQEQFTAPTTPGTYYFRCDVHPDTMNGSFIVK